MSDLEIWWREMPVVTRNLLAGSLLITLAANFRLLDSMSLILDLSKVIKHFQIWRLFTPFMFHRLGIRFLMEMIVLYVLKLDPFHAKCQVNFGTKLERGYFLNRGSDFFVMTTFFMICLIGIGHILKLALLGTPFITSIIYFWTRVEPEQIVYFMFGIRMKAKYLPWAMLGTNLITGASPILDLVGIIAGHLYWIIRNPLREYLGFFLLETPRFVQDFFGDRELHHRNFNQVVKIFDVPLILGNKYISRISHLFFWIVDANQGIFTRNTRFTGRGHRLGDE